MDILPLIFATVFVILTLVLGIVGVQIVLVLNEVRRTLHKLNATLDAAEDRLNAFMEPLQRLGGVASGIKSGLKVFETFVGWLHRETK